MVLAFIITGIVAFIVGWFSCNTWQAKAAAKQKQLLADAQDELNKLKAQAQNITKKL